MARLPRSLLYDYCNDVCYKMQAVELIVTQFFLASTPHPSRPLFQIPRLCVTGQI